MKQNDEYEILKTICNKIYIARNITLSIDDVLASLDDIDRWGRQRDDETNEED